MRSPKLRWPDEVASPYPSALFSWMLPTRLMHRIVASTNEILEARSKRKTCLEELKVLFAIQFYKATVALFLLFSTVGIIVYLCFLGDVQSDLFCYLFGQNPINIYIPLSVAPLSSFRSRLSPLCFAASTSSAT